MYVPVYASIVLRLVLAVGHRSEGMLSRTVPPMGLLSLKVCPTALPFALQPPPQFCFSSLLQVNKYLLSLSCSLQLLPLTFVGFVFRIPLNCKF